jgi:hypothetical protein
MKRLEGGYLGGRPTWSLASNPGVWAMEQVFARRAAGLWPVGSGSFDEFYEYVTLLLHMDGSNASTAFPDSSLRNLAVTAVSSSITTSQSKFGGAAGNFVRSSGGRLNVATTNSEFVFGAGDFTVEAWVYLNSLPTSGYPGSFWIFGWGPASANPGFDFYLTSTNIVVNITDFSSATATGVHGMSTGQWYHIAASRSGSAVKVFVNGQEKGSGSSTVDAVAPSVGNAIAISAAEPTGGSTGGNFDGFIDELRITKGYCRYTSTFSVPTAAFENDGAPIADPFYNYVSLLLPLNGSNNSTTFTDRSPGARTVTPSGDAKLLTAVKRYGVSSAYFDGTGDGISTTDVALSTGDFTIEMWVNTTSTTQYAQLIGNENPGFTLLINNGTASDGKFAVYIATLLVQTSTGGYNDGKWHHVALTRLGTTVTIWVDGVSAGTATSSASFSGSGNLWMGRNNAYAGRDFIGYIDDVRITKGVARYIANFIPPLLHADYGTLVDPYSNATTLLMPMEGPNGSAGFFDRADRVIATTYGNAKLTNAQARWGSTSALFDGTGDYVQLSSQPTIGTGDFTIEFWAYPNSISGLQGYVDFRPGQGAYPCIYQNGGTLNYFVNTGDRISAAGALTTGRWHHIAVTRRGTSTKMFCNGVQVGSTFSDSVSYLAPTVRLGNTFDGYAANVYLDDVRVTNGLARYVDSFSPPTAAFDSELSSDPYLSNVSLLLEMNGANNSTAFTDSSLTPKAIFTNGDAKISTVQSKFGGSSALFDGTGDSLQVSTTSDLQMTGDFTWEAWVYPTSLPGSGYRTLWAQRANAGGVGGPCVVFDTAGNLIYFISDATGSSWSVSGTDSTLDISLNSWQHIALVKSGSTIKLYKDGIGGTGVTHTTAVGAPSNTVIGAGAVDGSQSIAGYIDDLRITKGVARYTANFLPPTISHPVWSQADGDFGSVSLLLNGNGTNASTVVADRSSNALTLVPVDGAQISTTQSRFGGSSLYFDGTLDRFVIATNPVLNFSTGDFTIELWAYHTTFASNKFYISSEATGGLFFGQYSATQIGWGRANVAWDATPTHSMTVNTWYHIALTRSGSDMKLFVNGRQIGSANSSLAYDLSATATNIGSQTANYYHSGYLDDIRVTKGVARYTANFTPPVAPHPIPTIDPYFGAISLLLHMNGANASTYFPDHSYNALAVTANGNAQISTAQSKFGGASALFDGTGDYLSCSSTSLLFGIGNFTIELWFNVSVAFSGTSQTFAGVWSASNYAWLLQATSTSVVCAFGNGSAYATQITGNWTAPSTATWNHLAVTRSGTNAYIFLNGTQLATTTVSTNISGTGAMSIGRNADGDQQYMTGYIDSLRITKGIARYTTAFTPPTAQFPNS